MPPVIALFTKSDSIRKYDLSHVEAIMTAGAPLKESLERDITKKLGLKYFIQAYGMTEALSSITKTRSHTRNKPGSCGSVMPGLEVKVTMTKQNEFVIYVIEYEIRPVCHIYRNRMIIGY